MLSSAIPRQKGLVWLNKIHVTHIDMSTDIRMVVLYTDHGVGISSPIKLWAWVSKDHFDTQLPFYEKILVE